MRQEGKDLDNIRILQIAVWLRLLAKDLLVADQNQQALIACLAAKELKVAAPNNDCIGDVRCQWVNVISHASFGGLEQAKFLGPLYGRRTLWNKGHGAQEP
jgi:hypothetical protein